MLPAKFGLIWPDWLMLNKSSPLKFLAILNQTLQEASSFRGEDLFYISQSEKRIALGGHVYWSNGTK
jgi:hypothetical protein